MRTAVAWAVVALAGFGAASGRAQDESATGPTAEEMIETARERYRPPGTRRSCAPGAAGEIVVCAQHPDEFRVDSSLDEAIEAGDAVDDGIPRAPDQFGIAGGGVTVATGCFIPPCPKLYPPLIDLEGLPKALTPEEAALVRRAESPAEPDAPPP